MGSISKEFSRKKNTLFTFLIVTFSTFICMISAEMVVRFLFPFNTPETLNNHSLQYVPSLFARHRLKPVNRLVEVDSDRGWGIKNKSEKPHRTFFINEFGYRGPSFLPQKPEGVCRIVILGGSAVFDQNARPGNDWPHLVQKSLRKMGYSGVEVINGGVPGHATFDSLGRLYSQIWVFNPDLVILYNAWNDVKYFRTLTPENPLISLFKPYDEKGDLFTNYRGTLDRKLSTSQLYVKFRNRYFAWKRNSGLEGMIPEGEYQSSYGFYGLKQYKLNIELIVDGSRNIGATPLLLTQATLLSAQNSEVDRKKIGYEYQLLSHNTLVKALREANQVVRSVAQKKGVELLDLAETLSGRSELFTDHVHTSRKGSREIADSITRFVANQFDERSLEICNFTDRRHQRKKQSVAS